MRTLAVLLLLASAAFAQDTVSHASGSFAVKATPQTETNAPEGFSRTVFNKQFHGNLEATSVVWMVSSGSEGKYMVYVALEKVTGKLDGRSGTFVLQHTAWLQPGTPNRELNVIVVPESGTGELTGLKGKMNIRITHANEHFYDFEYTLPATK